MRRVHRDPANATPEECLADPTARGLIRAEDPAARARNWILLLGLAVAVWGRSEIFSWLWPETWSPAARAVLGPPLSGAISHGILFAWIAVAIRRRGLLWADLLRWPSRRELAYCALAALGLMAINWFGLMVSYRFFRWLSPDLARELLLGDDAVLLGSRPAELAASVLAVIKTGVTAPLLEELLFCGLLLPAWNRRWGTLGAISMVSLVFAVLHVHPVGTLVFRAFISLVFLRTGKLGVPISIHSIHNATTLLVAVSVELLDPSSDASLEDFEAIAWSGTVALPAGAMLLWLAWKGLASRSRAQDPDASGPSL